MTIINKILNKFGMRIIREYPRPSIKFIFRLNPQKDLKGVEIGTFEGENAESILETLNIKKLFLIDSYEKGNEKDSIHNKLKTTESKAMKKLKEFSHKIVWIKKLSSDAVNDVPDNLDFVYIDGDHRYKTVKKDLELYYPKLRIGGVLAGHDIDLGGHLMVNKPGWKNTEGVAEAVIEFATKKNLKLYMKDNDWWCVKE